MGSIRRHHPRNPHSAPAVILIATAQEPWRAPRARPAAQPPSRQGLSRRAPRPGRYFPAGCLAASQRRQRGSGARGTPKFAWCAFRHRVSARATTLHSLAPRFGHYGQRMPNTTTKCLPSLRVPSAVHPIPPPPTAYLPCVLHLQFKPAVVSSAPRHRQRNRKEVGRNSAAVQASAPTRPCVQTLGLGRPSTPACRRSYCHAQWFFVAASVPLVSLGRGTDLSSSPPSSQLLYQYFHIPVPRRIRQLSTWRAWEPPGFAIFDEHKRERERERE